MAINDRISPSDSSRFALLPVGCSPEKSKLEERREMTFPSLSLSRARSNRWRDSLVRCLNYINIEQKGGQILERTATLLDCNEARRTIKLTPWRRCTTGCLSRRTTPACACVCRAATKQTLSSGLICFFFGERMSEREVLMAPFDARTPSEER